MSQTFRTPEWLEHSFVLQEPASGVPVPRTAPDGAFYVRPPADEVDFGKVVRRSDVCRLSRRTTSVALVLTLLMVALFQLTGAQVYATLAVGTAAVALATSLLRLVLRRAPIPHRTC